MVKRALLAVLVSLAAVSFLQAATSGEKIAIPAGTVIHCRIVETVTTKLNTEGQAFRATVSEPVMIEGREAIPVGSTLAGRIASLQRPGRIKGVGEMRLQAETLALPNGRTFPLNAVLLTAYGAEDAKVVGTEGTIKGPSSRIGDVEEIGGGTGVGAFLGLLFSHPIVGATLGGTAGLVDRLRRHGKDLNIPAGTQLNYQLTRALEIEGSNGTRANVTEHNLGAGD